MRGSGLPIRAYTACRTKCSTTALCGEGATPVITWQILALIQDVEFAALEDLAKHVGASISTVRRDLTVLEAGGGLRRTHGGARVISPRTEEFTFSARDTHQLAEKEAIGRACAELIKPNQSVIIDAGTTAFHVAKFLEEKSPQIVTNSLPVANLFAAAASRAMPYSTVSS